MGLNIKNEQTVALVRELARHTGLSQTGAVEEAVRSKLAELEASRGRDARRARVDRTLVDLDQSLTPGQKQRIRREQRELYDDHGLPG